jgi:hypothetical protein
VTRLAVNQAPSGAWYEDYASISGGAWSGLWEESGFAWTLDPVPLGLLDRLLKDGDA